MGHNNGEDKSEPKASIRDRPIPIISNHGDQ